MNAQRGVLAPLLATALLLAAVIPIFALGSAIEEADLSPDGRVYEVNRDAAGHLFLSDYAEGDVWQVDPVTGAYQVYDDVIPLVGDARPDGAGQIWWTDNVATFGRIGPPNGDPPVAEVTSWELDGVQALWGVALDDAGRVWLTEWFGTLSKLRRFDPATGELCAYSWAGGVSSYYVLAQGGLVWLGNWGSNRILRFDPDSEEVTYWQIREDAVPVDIEPVGLALDGNGQLWWAEWQLGALARLEPEADRITLYALPVGSKPEMILPLEGHMIYTEDGQGTVGMLDPALADGSTPDVVSGTLPATVDCEVLKSGKAVEVDVESGVLAWTGSAVNLISAADGWQVYQFPEGGAPYGVVESQGYLWVSDYGRQKLVRFSLADESAVYLPLVSRGVGP